MAFEQTKFDLASALTSLDHAKMSAKRERIRKDDQQEFFSMTILKTIEKQIEILRDLGDLINKKT